MSLATGPPTLTHTQPPTGAGTTTRSRDTLAARTSFSVVRCAATSQRCTYASLVGSFTDDARAAGWDDSEHCAIARAVRFNYPRRANVWLYVGALTAAGVVGH